MAEPCDYADLAARISQMLAAGANQAELIGLLMGLLPQGDLPGLGPVYVQAKSQSIPANTVDSFDMSLRWAGRMDYLIAVCGAANCWSTMIQVDSTTFFLTEGDVQPVAPPAPGMPFSTNGMKVKWPVKRNSTITTSVQNATGAAVTCTVYVVVYRTEGIA